MSRVGDRTTPSHVVAQDVVNPDDLLGDRQCFPDELAVLGGGAPFGEPEVVFLQEVTAIRSTPRPDSLGFITQNAAERRPPRGQVRQVIGKGRIEGRERRTVLVHVLKAPADNIGWVALAQGEAQSFGEAGVYQVVRVEEQDVVPFGLVQAPIACRADALVTLSEYPNTRLSLQGSLDDRPGLVGGPVVHNNHFAERPFHQRKRLKRRTYEGRRVMCGNDHTEREHFQTVVHYRVVPRPATTSPPAGCALVWSDILSDEAARQRLPRTVPDHHSGALGQAMDSVPKVETCWDNKRHQSGVIVKPILVISATEPTAPNYGALMRLRVTVEALADIADVHLAVLNSRLGDVGLGGLPVTRAQRFPPPDRREVPFRERLLWFVRPTAPLNLAGLDYAEPSGRLSAWLADYSLIWVVRSPVYRAVRDVLPEGAPVVVDIDDLESEKLTGLLRATMHDAMGNSLSQTLSIVPSQLQGRRNAGAWRRLDRQIARAVDAAVVCSDEDARRLKAPNSVVVPNSYPDPAVRLGRRVVGNPPTILLQGSLAYPPNIDGAEFFVRAALPAIRAAHPDVRVRLVGSTSDRIDRLRGTPNVEVVGFVPHIEDELGKADVVIAPIRMGGGTRIKILESFAHEIPVVSTTVGAHGLGAVDERHLLIADTAEAFSRGCLRVLEDGALRETLAAGGRSLYEARYREDVVENSIAALAERHLVSGPDSKSRMVWP